MDIPALRRQAAARFAIGLVHRSAGSNRPPPILLCCACDGLRALVMLPSGSSDLLFAPLWNYPEAQQATRTFISEEHLDDGAVTCFCS